MRRSAGSGSAIPRDSSAARTNASIGVRTRRVLHRGHRRLRQRLIRPVAARIRRRAGGGGGRRGRIDGRPCRFGGKDDGGNRDGEERQHAAERCVDDGSTVRFAWATSSFAPPSPPPVFTLDLRAGPLRRHGRRRPALRRAGRSDNSYRPFSPSVAGKMPPDRHPPHVASSAEPAATGIENDRNARLTMNPARLATTPSLVSRRRASAGVLSRIHLSENIANDILGNVPFALGGSCRLVPSHSSGPSVHVHSGGQPFAPRSRPCPRNTVGRRRDRSGRSVSRAARPARDVMRRDVRPVAGGGGSRGLNMRRRTSGGSGRRG